MVNRKLVRPNLAEIKERFSPPRGGGSSEASSSSARETSPSNGSPRRRPSPPEQTSAEAFYYLKQMNGQTSMVLVLEDGEQLHGQIEWYDRACLKVNRDDAPNLLIYKHNIKYMYKQEDEAS